METRTLSPADVPALLELSGQAGWNQTAADWRRVMTLEPEGCFGLVADGRIVATSSLVRYGQALAWLGMVLTHPDHRGRGYGGTVTRAAMEYAWKRGVRVLKLDATDMGRPLYARLGFRDEAPIERWSARAEVPHPAVPHLPYRPELELDHAAFGADRSALLGLLAGCGFSAGVERAGFVMARQGSRAVQLGPCVAREADIASALVRAALAWCPRTEVYWDLLPANPRAVDLARSLGFAPARRLVRMSIHREAPDVTHDDGLVYAAAGFEYG